MAAAAAAGPSELDKLIDELNYDRVLAWITEKARLYYQPRDTVEDRVAAIASISRVGDVKVVAQRLLEGLIGFCRLADDPEWDTSTPEGLDAQLRAQAFVEVYTRRVTRIQTHAVLLLARMTPMNATVDGVFNLVMDSGLRPREGIYVHRFWAPGHMALLVYSTDDGATYTFKYLTTSDGPHRRNLAEILEVLTDEHGYRYVGPETMLPLTFSKLVLCRHPGQSFMPLEQLIELPRWKMLELFPADRKLHAFYEWFDQQAPGWDAMNAAERGAFLGPMNARVDPGKPHRRYLKMFNDWYNANHRPLKVWAVRAAKNATPAEVKRLPPSLREYWAAHKDTEASMVLRSTAARVPVWAIQEM